MIAIQFESTVTLGAALLGVLIAVGTVSRLLYGAKYRTAYEVAHATAEELRKALLDEKARVERLEVVLAAERDRLKHAAEAIARLEALPDLGALVRILDQHESRAQERHERTAAVLTALVERVEKLDGKVME